MDIKQIITNDLNNAFKKCGFNGDAVVTFSARPEICDFQCNNVFALAKSIGKNPLEVAKNVVDNMEKNVLYDTTFLPPAFINFTITKDGLSTLAKDIYINGNAPEFKDNKTVFFDYGGANVAKELHVGHLRSPIIGESLARLYRLLGNKVITDTHLGDWGLQMGLTIAQLEDDGYLEGAFGRGTDKEITLDTLNEEYPKASKRKKEEPEFLKKAELYTLYVQHQQEPYYGVYKKLKAISIKQIKFNYDQLNCHFDLWEGESDAEPYTEKMLKMFEDKHLTKESGGATIVDVAIEGENIPTDKVDANGNVLYKNPMPPIILKKHNGADIYATTELATILRRNELYHPDKIVYITDARQGLHFKQVFRAAKLAGISPANQELQHIVFGTINGKDGKAFKTRSGETIKLSDIVNMLKEKASEKLAQNGIVGDDKLALQIGVGAMKFGDLINVVNKDYVFDIDRFTSFEGKTGPYIQYTAVRIKSILNKANMATTGEITISSEEERKIVLAVLKLTNAFLTAYKDSSLNAICLGLYDLCSAYSNFYNNIRIISEKDETKKQSYLSLSKLVLNAIETGANVLAIDIPDKM